jgi:hypothetical protein
VPHRSDIQIPSFSLAILGGPLEVVRSGGLFKTLQV